MSVGPPYTGYEATTYNGLQGKCDMFGAPSVRSFRGQVTRALTEPGRFVINLQTGLFRGAGRLPAGGVDWRCTFYFISTQFQVVYVNVSVIQMFVLRVTVIHPYNICLVPT